MVQGVSGESVREEEGEEEEEEGGSQDQHVTTPTIRIASEVHCNLYNHVSSVHFNFHLYCYSIFIWTYILLFLMSVCVCMWFSKPSWLSVLIIRLYASLCSLYMYIYMYITAYCFFLLS